MHCSRFDESREVRTDDGLRAQARSDRSTPSAGRREDVIDTPVSGLRPTLDSAHPLFCLGYAQPVAVREFARYTDGVAAADSAAVPEEVPVALIYNGRPHVVMMCTPADIVDFALGFSLTEEIVQSASDVLKIAPVHYSQGIEVEVTIPAAAASRLDGRGRALVGRTGCGLCGVTTIDDVLRVGTAVSPTRPFSAEAIYRAAAELPAFQSYNASSNAVHAAGWADRAGQIVLAREDVGRHNALDKLIGAMSRDGVDPTAGFAIVTSRASYELVQKCAVARIALLAAISRPTGLAIRMAEAAGITLVGLVRGRTANVYTSPAPLGHGPGPENAT